MSNILPIASIILLTACIALFVSLCKADSSCIYTIGTATYDLELLRMSSKTDRKFHVISDADETRHYKYYFNFCDSVQEMPLDICSNATLRPTFAQGYCPSIPLPNETQCAQNIIQIANNAYAYQVEDTLSHCFRLSNEDGGPMQWNLYDTNDPSAGITMQLGNGDFSPHCKNPSKNRNLEIVMRCDPANVGVDLSDVAFVEEDADKEVCSYKMELQSIWGCPTQCGIYNNALCNNHGICSYDFSNEYPKCFCFSHFGGDGCQKENEDAADDDSKDDSTLDTDFPATKLTPVFTPNDTAIQFDLRDIAELNKVIDDNDGSVSPYISIKDYKFHFQFEENIDMTDKLPASCINASLPCNKAVDPDCDDIGVSNGVGVAFRIDNRDSSCVLLGRKSLFKTALFDIKQPAKGIVVTYDGGYLPDSNENAQFRIELECPNMAPDYYERIAAEGKQEVEVGKYAANMYSVHFRTPLACPAQCREYDDVSAKDKVRESDGTVHVCNSRGVCALDPHEKATHCLCDDGWDGDYCAAKLVVNPSGNSGNVFTSVGFIVAIVILSVLLIVVSIFGFLKYKHWKQRAELAYAQFGDNELANDLMHIGPQHQSVDDIVIEADAEVVVN